MVDIKAIFRQLVPPIIIDVLKGRSNIVLYPSRHHASLACRGQAYEDSILTDFIARKTRLINVYGRSISLIDPAVTRPILAISKCISSREQLAPLRVLDFGGAAGSHYFISRTFFGPSVCFKWAVVESGQMVRSSKDAGLASENLSFFRSIEEASDWLGGVDLVYTSSALQYCPDPLDTLIKLVECKASSLVITRTPFSSSGNYYGVQSSGLLENGERFSVSELQLSQRQLNASVEYPIEFIDKATVEEILRRDYSFVVALEEEVMIYRAQGHAFSHYSICCW